MNIIQSHTRLLMVAMLSAVLLFACKFNSDYQGEGEPALQGTWVQDSIPLQDSLMQYTLHEFRFSCDSVYITLHTIAKQPIVVDACFNEGKWTEYARGLYVIRNDSLLIEATYVHASGKQKLTGCYRIGQYLSRMKIVSLSEDSLKMEDKNSFIPLALRRTATTTCIPKIVY